MFNKMNLQYFADPNASDGDNQPNQASESANDTQPSSVASSSSSSNASPAAVAKYTQSDMDKAMANKDHEVTAKLKTSMQADFKAQTQSMVSSAMSYGAKRAQMTDDQKKSADRKSSEAAAKSMAKQLASYKAQDVHNKAVSTATEALSSAGVTNANSVAAFVADSDSAKQASKASAFVDWYKAMTDGVKKSALSPNTNPSGASANIANGPSSAPKDPTEMTATQYMLYRMKNSK